MIHQHIFNFKTPSKSTVEITAEISAWVESTKLLTGICHLFIQHTSASLIICENADKLVRVDLHNFMESLVPEDEKLYQHVDEGADDMPAHIKTILTGCSLSIPIVQGRLGLGTWQGIYIWEHRHQSHQRKVIATLLGE